MCLNIGEQRVAKIAKRNFVVTKYLRKPFTNEKGEKLAKSPYIGFYYTLGKEYTVNAGFVKRKKPYSGGSSISKGLHSMVKGHKRSGMEGSKYYAIIPKGAYYIIGQNNEIVSNKLIVKKRWVSTKKK